MPERYKVQFTASQEYVDLLQQAKDLASHALPSGAIEQLHLQAMRLLVAELKKRRCAALKPGRAVKAPRQRQRVDAVWSRDDARCTYVDSRGERCRETTFIELHHVHPHARGGPTTEANLTLRCRMHNALAAEQDFGRELIEGKRRRGEAAVVGAAPR